MLMQLVNEGPGPIRIRTRCQQGLKRMRVDLQVAGEENQREDLVGQGGLKGLGAISNYQDGGAGQTLLNPRKNNDSAAGKGGPF